MNKKPLVNLGLGFLLVVVLASLIISLSPPETKFSLGENPEEKGIISYYDFEGNFDDYYGQYDLKENEEVSFCPNGKFGKAGLFKGGCLEARDNSIVKFSEGAATSHYSAPALGDFEDKDFSMSFWINFNEFGEIKNEESRISCEAIEDLNLCESTDYCKRNDESCVVDDPDYIILDSCNNIHNLETCNYFGDYCSWTQTGKQIWAGECKKTSIEFPQTSVFLSFGGWELENSTDTSGWGVYYDKTSETLMFHDWGARGIYARAPMEKGSWYHIVLSRENNRVNLYVNSKKVYSNAFIDLNTKETDKLILGQDSKGAGAFNGLMDDLIFFDRALTIEEINQLSFGIDPQAGGAMCGNSEVEYGEICDDGDNNGNYGYCNVECSGMSPYCGDNLIQDLFGEICDDGASNGLYGWCNSDCSGEGEHCGDGIIQINEICDDGNDLPTDGCSNDCKVNDCGNSILEDGEFCDVGWANGYYGSMCNLDCTNLGEYCGNGIQVIETGEICDDGERNGEYGYCSETCEDYAPYCGDENLDAEFGEECDDGNGLNNDACLEDCTFAYCGDGYINIGIEQCDDGNNETGDGCSDTCQFEATQTSCWDDDVTPHPICSCGDLQNMETHLDWNYILRNDIDCANTITWNDGKGFIPVGGKSGNAFKGNFYGKGYVIKDLYVDRSDGTPRAGLFGEIQAGNIKDLGLENINISGVAYVGGIVGISQLNTNITDVYVTGNIKGDYYAGGISGLVRSSNVQNGYVILNTELNQNQMVGYVSGYADGMLLQNVFSIHGPLGGYLKNGNINNSWYGNVSEPYSNVCVTQLTSGEIDCTPVNYDIRYFWGKTNEPINSWRDSIWEKTGLAYPTLKKDTLDWNPVYN